MTRQTYKKIIVNEELLNMVNPENKKLRDRFLKEKNSRSSDGTVEGYLSDLNIFFCWNVENNNNKLFTDIKKIEFSDFFSFAIEEMKWGSARFSRMRACLSSFSNFIEKYYDDVYPNFRNLILKAIESMPKNEVREKTILQDEQINRLFKELDEQNEIQISCWLALGIASGSRFSELLRFTIDIIDENNTAFDGLFLETTKPIKTKGRTKTGKLLKKYILKDLFLERYKKWLEERQKILLKNNKEHNFLFIKDNGDPLGEAGARTWIDKIEKILKCNFYPHAMRHAFTTLLSSIGLPPELIKFIIGWESIDMVSLYDDTDAKEKDWKEIKKLKIYLEDRNVKIE